MLLEPVTYSLIRIGGIQYNCTSGILQKPNYLNI
jgi:hypothetical protein